MFTRLKTFWNSYRTELIIFLIALPYLIAQNTHGGDFRILLTGAGYLAKGLSPYGIIMPIEPGITDVLLYSPFVAFVLMPFTYLPEIIPTFIFSLINFFILFRIWYVMSRWLQIGGFSSVKRRWWYIITIAFIVRFIMHVFENSQQNIVVLYLSLEGLHLIFLRNKAAGGFLLALGICIKLLPIVFLPYLVYKRKFSATLATVSLFILLLLLPATWFGLTFDLHLLQGWWAAINPTLDKYNTQQNVGVQFHCISALIPVYFSDSNYHGFSVNIMNLPPDKLFLLINAVRLFLISFTLCFLWIGRSAKEQSALFIFWQLSYIFLLIPLIFPHQAKYSYVNLLPAFGYLAYYLLTIYDVASPAAKRHKTILLAGLAIVFILTTLTADVIWGMANGKYFQFLKLVTIGALFAIPILFYFSPKRLLVLLNSEKG